MALTAGSICAGIGGYWRNDRMVEVSGKVAAFWDGQSRGSGYTRRKAQAAGKLIP